MGKSTRRLALSMMASTTSVDHLPPGPSRFSCAARVKFRMRIASISGVADEAKLSMAGDQASRFTAAVVVGALE